jgi:UDPglucose 6-dehydrogenase
MLGADIEHIINGIGSDSRIGYSFIYPGCCYGGSCFPKDVKALERTAQQMGYKAELLNAVENVNDRQKQVLFNKVVHHYQGDLQGKTFALWGLAFKPKTDDMRDAPSRVILGALINAGANVRAFDLEAMTEAKRTYGDKSGLTLFETAEEPLLGANALIVVTEWKNFWSPDFDLIKKTLKDKVIFDGRNLYQPALLEKQGITYYAIGRGKNNILGGSQ